MKTRFFHFTDQFTARMDTGAQEAEILSVGGVLIALVTSLNAIFAWCTRGLYMATKDG